MLPVLRDQATYIIEMGDLAPASQRAYKAVILEYIDWVRDNRHSMKEIKDLFSASNLTGFLAHQRNKGNGKQRINVCRSAVIYFAKSLYLDGKIDGSVVANLRESRRPRAESGQRPGNWLTEAQVQQLLSSCWSGEERAQASRDTAIIALLVLCGLRRQEVVKVTWADITSYSGYPILRVHGKGEKLRLVKIPALVVQLLNGWAEYCPDTQEKTPVFVSINKAGKVTGRRALHPEAIPQIVRKAIKASGLDSIHVTPHDLRRTFARGAYESGISFELIRQALGHASVTTTERYVAAAQEIKNAATDQYASQFRVDNLPI